MKPLFLLFALVFCVRVHSVSFTDDLGRTVHIEHPRAVASLQGSLATLWLLSGGTLAAATTDCFLEPPKMTSEKAAAENKTWKTDGFFSHQNGVFSLFGKSSSDVLNVGAMMSPNAELLISSGVDFALLSAKQGSHKKIESTLEKAGITCAFFNYDDFQSFLRIFDIFCKITHSPQNFEKFGKMQEERIAKIISKKSGNQKSILTLRASTSRVQAKKSSDTTAGTILFSLGCRNVADTDKDGSAEISMEKILSDEPDFIFVVTMGVDEQKALESVKKTLESNPAWKTLRAVKNGRYFVLPRELYHFKAGARWAESYEILSKLFEEK